MATAEKLAKLGEKLNLKGDELRQWIDAQIAHEIEARQDEDRRKKEEDERKEREYQRRNEEQQAEEERQQKEEERRQREEDRQKREDERKRKTIEDEMALIRLQVEHSTLIGAQSPSHSFPSAKAPRMTPFDEKQDELDSYLKRFERYATTCRWPREQWSTHLAALLRHKSLDVYSRMEEEDADDYDKLKIALLKRYNLTHFGFLEKFRESRPTNEERFSQFRTRIIHYFDKCLELGGKTKNSAEDIKDMVVKEQLLNACGTNLQTFLKERDPKTSQELVELAEKYVDAHGVAGAYTKGNTKRTEKPPNQSHSPSAPNAPPSQKYAQLTCKKCGRRGHIAKDCYTKVGAVETEGPVSCDYCKKKGHVEADCWGKKRDLAATHHNVSSVDCEGHGHVEMKCGCRLPMLSAVCHSEPTLSAQMPVATGRLDGKKVDVLRDSGCSCVVIRRSLIDPGKCTGPQTAVRLADGKVVSATMVQVHLDCPYFNGTVTAVTMETPLYDVILGNVPGAKCPGTPIPGREVSAVETRAASHNKKLKKLLTPDAVDTRFSVQELIQEQERDPSLKLARELAKTKEVKKSGKDNTWWFSYEKGILTRFFSSPKVDQGDHQKQIVVPLSMRKRVMAVGHENIMAGHLGTKKTCERILTNFYWPNVWQDVTMFCQSCDQCQRSAPKGTTAKVPMEVMPLIDEPFSRIALDIVGPIVPASERGHRYILTAVDYATRFPEAVSLKTIDTQTVAEALVDIFSRIGIPKEILTDRGTQFTSELMSEVCRLLSVKRLTTSPYHPQCNGLVEKFNGTLKNMLKKLASERPRDWDRYVSAALFAYREAPQESLGFSPFEMVFGRSVRGPMHILRELMTEDCEDMEVKTTYQYVLDLKSKIEKTVDLAKENLKITTGRYKAHFDKRTRPRKFAVGDSVLILLPKHNNKLQLKWQGPFQITEIKGHNNYAICVNGQTRSYHINMLKAYSHRDPETNVGAGALSCATAAVISESDEYEGGRGKDSDEQFKVETITYLQTETVEDIKIFPNLDEEKKGQLQEIFTEFKDVLTDVPGKTSLVEHDIRLTSKDPIRKKPYPVAQALRETMREEVEKMIEAGIIEPSSSPYSSPSVVVKKKDGSNRYCIDFRALNNVSEFDAEPMPRPDEIFQEVGINSKFITKIDLSKGYWQIPLEKNARPLTAFATEKGLYQFTVMPFGLQGAPATFSRLMRKVLNGARRAHNYLDDIVLSTETWEDHVEGLRDTFRRLRQAGLTARPSKCLVAFDELELLGHKIGNGRLTPTVDKVEAIKNAKPPQNKKEMRSFLGLASFYKRYVPNFSAIASPLTDATRKGKPNKINWEEPQMRAFQTLKQVLSSKPVLRLPDFNKPFSLRTDASDRGLGAILMQEHEGEYFPVVYLSRKLLPREERYSVVEKECLGIVWAIKSLHTYLYGREFEIQTDHAPLLYLNRAKSENGKLMRWALLLDQYRFHIRAIAGKDNHGPDFLSRIV